MPNPIPKQEVTRRKYRSIQNRFKELYNVKRVRYDDVIAQLMEEYFIMHPDTISKILNTEVPEGEVYVDPNQMKMFSDEDEKRVST